MMDIAERLRKRAEMQTATGIPNSEDHIDWIADDEIERLRKVLQEIADKDGWCSAKAVAKRLREAGYVDINTIYKMAEEAADEIERLREALKFYADEKRWRQEWDNQFHRIVCDAHSDGGAIALAALKDGE